jgi:hypothetical protein
VVGSIWQAVREKGSPRSIAAAAASGLVGAGTFALLMGPVAASLPPDAGSAVRAVAIAVGVLILGWMAIVIARRELTS